MIRTFRFAASALVLAAPLTADAHQRSSAASASTGGITAREIAAHLRFLSHDLLEGRAPATRGGELAARYIAGQLRAYGVEPGGANGSYFQRVPIDVVAADSGSLGPMLAAMIRPIGMRISPEKHPERGYFYRSDHFSFADAEFRALRSLTP